MHEKECQMLTYIDTTEVEDTSTLVAAIVGTVEKHCMNKMLRDDAQWALWYVIQHSEGTNSFLVMRCARLRKAGMSNPIRDR